ncbi:MAG: hypothetical protein OEY18_15280, partial [Candidatus Aminicenantes bacterium]|nr:hypothetical protein [Candidatus Aminicenantes bacterium]
FLFLDPESKFLSHEILRDKKVKIESTKDILKKIKEESNDIVELNGMRRKDDEGLQIKKYDSLPSLHIIKCEGLKRLYVYHYCRPSIKDEQSPLLIEINKEVSPKMYETYNCHFDYVWKESAFFD